MRAAGGVCRVGVQFGTVERGVDGREGVERSGAAVGERAKICVYMIKV